MTVYLFVLDCVRRDAFDRNANKVRELADAECECRSASTWTIPSHASMWTGDLPHEHGVHSYDPDFSDIEVSYSGSGVTANSAISDSFGADEIWNEWKSHSGVQEATPDAITLRSATLEHDEGVGRYLAYLKMGYQENRLLPTILNGLHVKANNILRETSRYPIGDHGASTVIRHASKMEDDLVFANFIDAHAPMENLRCLDSDIDPSWTSNDIDSEVVRRGGHEDELEMYWDLYESNIRYMDDLISEFWEDECDGDDTVIVTSDHGEMIGDENDLGHKNFSHTLIDVPLVVIGQDINVDGIVSQLDMPQIVRSFIDGDPEIPTRDLIPVERPGMMFYDGDDPWYTRWVRGVYDGDIRWEWDNLGNRYRVETTRSTDISRERRVDRIPSKYRSIFPEEFDDKDGQDVDVSEGVEDRLSQLGYKA